ncbi:hypothetical protein [Microbacterium deminutum]|uniref:Uncharacterized protein n=1 Tax=Microbacterium deminutum TaxID=344164 RepID=A0ABP5CWR8_9MICO
MTDDASEALVYDTHSYLAQREGWRARTRLAFFASPHARAVFDLVRHSVTDFVYGMSGRSWETAPHADYYVGLQTAYLRTQGLVLDLARDCEVIDGATLLRRQIEVIARLRELDEIEDLSELLKRTPNVNALKSPVRALYGSYSEIAHSSVDYVFDLLASGEAGFEQWVSVYPKFTPNSHVLFQNAAVVHLEFLLWVRDLGDRTGIAIERHYVDGSFAELVEALNAWATDPEAATSSRRS